MFLSKVFAALASAVLAQGAVIPHVQEVEKRDFTPLVLPFNVQRGVNITTMAGRGFHRSTYAKQRAAKLAKRDDPTSIAQEDGFYEIDFTIGSNNQQIGAIIDTGSSDLWVNDVSSSCTGCSSYGFYNPSTSSTSKELTSYPEFSIEYVGQNTALGQFYSDTITIGNGKVTGAIFADVTDSASGPGIFGIAEKAQEADTVDGFTYTNIPAQMVKDGVIPSNAYSLYLNSADATSGVLIFGGYDEDKVDGSFTKFDIQQQTDLAAPFSSMAYNGHTWDFSSAISATGMQPALDSGTTYWILPQSGDNVFQKVVDSVNGQVEELDDEILVFCSCDVSGPVTFTWEQNFSIEIDMSDLIVETDGVCQLTVMPDDYLVFGDIIIRHLYIIYDISAGTISLAKVNYTSSSNIVPFSS